MAETPEQTFRKMTRIRASGSRIERLLGAALWKAGFRYRKQYAAPGRPDFALASAQIAIFCDSTFWHGYRWGRRTKATFKKNRSFWIAKIEANRARDRRVDRSLKAAGWKVLRFWEHEIKQDLDDCLRRINQALAAPRSGIKRRRLSRKPRHRR